MALRALSTAATAGRALLHRSDTIAQHIANASTPAYKRARTQFADLLYQRVHGPGPAGAPMGTGVRVASTEKLFEQGALQRTGLDLDLAIEGEGFLRVLLPDGTAAYTRGGHLRIDGRGALVTQDGYPIDPPVVLPEGIERVVVDAAGRILGLDPGTGETVEEMGQLGMTRFLNPSGLEPLDGNLYQATPSSGAGLEGLPGGPEGFGWIRQGFLESSNVDAAKELTDLIAAQRAFELNAKVIEAADEILQAVNNMRRDRS